MKNYFLISILGLVLVGCSCNSEKQKKKIKKVEAQGRMQQTESDKIYEEELAPQVECLIRGETASQKGDRTSSDWDLKVKCCDGLVDREDISVCGKGIMGGYVYVCVACGDGQCQESYENNCNCPEDCK